MSAKNWGPRNWVARIVRAGYQRPRAKRHAGSLVGQSQQATFVEFSRGRVDIE